MKRNEITITVLVLLSFLVGTALYSRLPEQMASHWNAQGQVDDYLPRFWGVFLLPTVMTALWLMFVAIPRIDPLRENIASFRKHYDLLVLVIILFMLAVYAHTLLWSLGIQVGTNQLVSALTGLLFFFVGVTLQHAKRNWFVGIRTPWTLSSDAVWQKTHYLGARIFKLTGVLALLGLLLPTLAIYLVLVPVVTASIIIVVYSYFCYQKIEME
tara:strand:- start:1416 stop:2054 length:639 start_codon:yes stop_codon:yes gene_type:complete